MYMCFINLYEKENDNDAHMLYIHVFSLSFSPRHVILFIGLFSLSKVIVNPMDLRFFFECA